MKIPRSIPALLVLAAATLAAAQDAPPEQRNDFRYGLSTVDDLTIYSDALAAPAAHAAIVIAFDGDPIDRAVKAHPEGLREIERFHTTGQPAGTIYLSDTDRSAEASPRP